MPGWSHFSLSLGARPARALLLLCQMGNGNVSFHEGCHADQQSIR